MERDRVLCQPDAIVGNIGSPCAGDVAVAEMVEGVDLPRVDLAAVDGEFTCVRSERCDGRRECTAGLHLGKLAVVADQDDFGTTVAGGDEEVMQIDGAAHAGL